MGGLILAAGGLVCGIVLHSPPYLLAFYPLLAFLVFPGALLLNRHFSEPRVRLQRFFRTDLHQAYESAISLLIEIAQNLNIGREHPLAAHIRFAVVEPSQELFAATERAIDQGIGTRALERHVAKLCWQYQIIEQSVLASLDVPSGIDSKLEAQWRNNDAEFRKDLRTLASDFAYLRNVARAKQLI